MIRCVKVAFNSVMTRRSSSGLIARRFLHVDRAGQEKRAALMLRERPLQQSVVQPCDVLGDVLNRVVGDDVEPNVRVAQGKVEIEHRHAVRRILSENTREVDRQRRAADSTRRAGDRVDLAAADFRFAFAESVDQLDPMQGGQKILNAQRIVEELLGPVAHRLQDEAAFGRGAHHEDAARGQLLRDAGDHRQALRRVGVDRDERDVRLRLHHDIGEEFVARALRFQPDDVDSQKQLLERGPRRVVGINDGKSTNAFHQTNAFAGLFSDFLCSCRWPANFFARPLSDSCYGLPEAAGT